MRKLKSVAIGDLDFIKGVIDSTNKRKGEDQLPKEETFKGRCHARVDAHKDYNPMMLLLPPTNFNLWKEHILKWRLLTRRR